MGKGDHEPKVCGTFTCGENGDEECDPCPKEEEGTTGGDGTQGEGEKK